MIIGQSRDPPPPQKPGALSCARVKNPDSWTGTPVVERISHAAVREGHGIPLPPAVSSQPIQVIRRARGPRSDGITEIPPSLSDSHTEHPFKTGRDPQGNRDHAEVLHQEPEGFFSKPVDQVTDQFRAVQVGCQRSGPLSGIPPDGQIPPERIRPGNRIDHLNIIRSIQPTGITKSGFTVHRQSLMEPGGILNHGEGQGHMPE